MKKNCAFYALADVTSNVVPTVHLRHIYCPFLCAFIVHCNVHYNVQLNVPFNSCDVCKMHIARTIRCVKDLLTMYIVKSFGMSPGMHVVFFEMSEFAYNVQYKSTFQCPY